MPAPREPARDGQVRGATVAVGPRRVRYLVRFNSYSFNNRLSKTGRVVSVDQNFVIASCLVKRKH